MHYLTGDPRSIMVSHGNLGLYFGRNEQPHESLAHLIAATLIGHQTQHRDLKKGLKNLSRALGDPNASQPPVTFDDLVDLLNQTPGTDFAALQAALPQTEDTPDETLQKVLHLADTIDPVGDQLDIWQPVIDAVADATRNHQALPEDLTDTLAGIHHDPDWTQLVETINHIHNTYPNHQPLPYQDLDDIDQRITQQLLASLNDPQGS